MEVHEYSNQPQKYDRHQTYGCLTLKAQTCRYNHFYSLWLLIPRFRDLVTACRGMYSAIRTRFASALSIPFLLLVLRPSSESD